MRYRLGKEALAPNPGGQCQTRLLQPSFPVHRFTILDDLSG